MPRWPYRLRRQGGNDGVARARGGVVERMLHVGGRPIRARAWQTRERYVHIRVEGIDPVVVEHPVAGNERETRPAEEAELEIAIERIRFSLAVEEEMGDFYDAFKRDRLLGPTIHHKPWVRPRRRAWPWEALCWAITEQLIQTSRAAEIQRRIVRRRGPPAPKPGIRHSPLRGRPSAPGVEGRGPPAPASAALCPGRRRAQLA